MLQQPAQWSAAQVSVERVDLAEVTAEQTAKLFSAEQLLLQLALQGGRQIRLGSWFHRRLMKCLGDHREPTHGIEHTGRALLHQQRVVRLPPPGCAARAGSGEERDRAARADTTFYIQGMQD
jgi:hypothetical protein